VLALTHDNEDKTGISSLSGLRQLTWIDSNTLLVVESVTGGKIVDYVVLVQFEVKEGAVQLVLLIGLPDMRILLPHRGGGNLTRRQGRSSQEPPHAG
jgi:hypothetical protein